MPITWLNKHRSALALSIFFPWFPPFPVSPPAEPPAVAVEAAAPASEEPMVLPGVVIEEIPKGSALEKAGLQVGDVILSWERLPNPPANPEGARRELGSYFDWLELEVEQVPRGAVILRGRRGGVPMERRVEPGLWEAKVRPVLPAALEVAYAEGKARLAAESLDAAVQSWGTLVGSAATSGSGDVQAWGALRIGDAWGEQGEWGKAAKAYQDAVEAAKSPIAQIAGWEALGDARKWQSEVNAAEQAYDSALKISQGLRFESLGVVWSLHNLGNLAKARGDLLQAKGYFLRALNIGEKIAPESLTVASSLYYLGGVIWAQGDLVKAKQYALRALKIEETLSPQSHRVSSSLGLLGAIAYGHGDLSLAYDYYLQAFRIDEQFYPDSLSVATSLNNLAVVATSRGELDSAYHLHTRAFQIRKRLVPQSRFVGSSLNNLGIVMRERGELDRAHSYFSQALEIYEQVAPGSLHVANSLTNLGAVAHDLGDMERAYGFHLRALRLRRELAPGSLQEAASLNNLGNAAWARGDLDESHKWHLQAMQIKERHAPGSLAVAASLNNLGTVAQELKKYEEALEMYRQALQIYENLVPQSFLVAKTLNNMAFIASAQNDLRRSYSYYMQALDTFERQLSRHGSSYDAQAEFRSEYRSYYLAPLDLLLVQKRFLEAFQVLERSRAQTFLSMLAERDTAFAVDIPEDLDRERRRLSVKYGNTLKKLAGLNSRDNYDEIEYTRRELQRLDQEAGDIEARIRQASPRLAALKYPKPLTAAETQQMLDPGTLLISYSVGKEETMLFALSRSGDLEVKVLSLGEAALRSRVEQLLDLISEVRTGSSVTSSISEQRQLQLRNASRGLYASLLGPVTERIASSERILILPDGPLHVLPFGALVRDDGPAGQYLAEWKPLHVALSATVFAELKQRRRSAGDHGSIRLAAFGDPVYPQSLTKADSSSGDPIVRSAAERGVFDWQPLPYTRREVEGIANLFPAGTARTFLGSEALEERIKSLDPKTRILHLAAHGYTDEHLPSSSFVALTIPEDAKSDVTIPERDNGLLQVWEIFERVRIDADLVVLSACDTGLGKELGGEGLIGLTRAFQYAGARTVMASLWSIQDQATSELMIRFYKHLRAGLPKDEALRQAQMELIRGPIEVVNEKGEKTLFDASAPYYWAGIQVYGDWQ